PRLERLLLLGAVHVADERLDRLLDRVENGLGHEEARVGCAGHGREQAAAGQRAHGAACRAVAYIQGTPHLANRDKRRHEELVDERQKRLVTVDAVARALAEQRAGLLIGTLGGLTHPL